MENLCKCGNDINHLKVIHKSEYSKWGWFLFTVLGLSAKPKSVKFVCSDCKDTISVSTDPKILKKYIGR